MLRPWLLPFVLALLVISSPAAAVSFLVDTTTSAVDANPGDGQCRTAAGQCSLRAAVMETNALPSNDQIGFNIAPGGAQQINLVHTDSGGNTSSLTITSSVVIDGSSQSGFNGSPLIQVHCQNAFNGLIVAAANVQIRNLAFTGFPQNGLRLDGNNALVENVWFGVRLNGTSGANGLGVLVNGSGNRIERGRFSGNTGGGIGFSSISDSNQMVDSFFDIFPAGNCPIGSAPLVRVSGNANQVGPGNTIGGTTADAVRFEGATNSSFVGNYVGTTAFNTATCPIGGSVVLNGGSGLVVNGNVIAGLGSHGLLLDGVAGASVTNNLVGLRADGSPFGNGGDGVRIEDSSEIIVGAGADGSPGPNRVGANLDHGLACRLSDLLIAYNTVGTDGSGSINLGNAGDGFNATNCSGASHHNLFYFNDRGVALLGNATLINNRSNSYNGNRSLAVDIDRDGPTPNDPGDLDLGPNLRLNTLEEATVGSNTLAFDPASLGLAPGVYEAGLHLVERCSSTFGIAHPVGTTQVYVIELTIASDPRAAGTLVELPLVVEFPAYAVQLRSLQHGVSSELSRCFSRPGGWLGDRVWRDLNRDGLQGEREPGIPGLLVTLLDSSGATLDTRITGPDGRYRFADLASGSYRLRFALAPGHSHTIANVGADDSIDSDVITVAGTTDLFTYIFGTVDSTRDSGQVPEIHVNTFEGFSVQPPQGG